MIAEKFTVKLVSTLVAMTVRQIVSFDHGTVTVPALPCLCVPCSALKCSKHCVYL